MARRYYLGKGKVKLYNKNANGTPGKLLFFSNAPELKLSISVEEKEHTESFSGTNAVDNRVVIKTSAEGSVTMDELSEDTYGLLVKGTKRTLVSGTVSNHNIPSTMANGDEYKLPGTGLTAVTVMDTAGTPVAVPAGKYSIDVKNGTFTVIDKSGTVTTSGWNVSFTYAAITYVTIIDNLDKELYLSFEGVNLADNSNVLLEIPKARFQPASDIDFIGDDYGKFPMKFTPLPDEALAAIANWDDIGTYGRLVFNPAGA